jgi:hypothetical protein
MMWVEGERMSPIPVSLILLSIIALVLHLLSHYLIPNSPVTPPNRYFWPVVGTVVIIVVLLLWYVLPLRVGG